MSRDLTREQLQLAERLGDVLSPHDLQDGTAAMLGLIAQTIIFAVHDELAQKRLAVLCSAALLQMVETRQAEVRRA